MTEENKAEAMSACGSLEASDMPDGQDAGVGSSLIPVIPNQLVEIPGNYGDLVGKIGPGYSNSELALGVFDVNKAILMNTLIESGATYLTVTYEGQGDSGDIEDVSSDAEVLAKVIGVLCVEHVCEDGKWISRIAEAEMNVKDVAKAMCETLIDKHHCGYENNDGGGGEMTVDVNARSVTFETRDYYVESSTNTYEV